ncbi:GTP-binding protein [Streptomyces cacaoi]
MVAGGFGAGKTTLVGAVSEITPLLTEATLTQGSEGTDVLAGVESKTTTTVAMDFGKITLTSQEPPGIVLMLFGTPGQDRFRRIWDDLATGAAGAVVLVDTRRLADAFDAVAYFEQQQLPFLIAVNLFDGAPRYLLDEIRHALRLDDATPVVTCDARNRQSVRAVLSALVHHALTRLPTSPRATLGAPL